MGRKREFLCWGTAWGCGPCGHEGISPLIFSQLWLSPCSSSLHCLHYPLPAGNRGAVLAVLPQILPGSITPTSSSYQSVLHALKGSVPWDKNREKNHDVSGCRFGYLISIFKQRILMEYVSKEVGLG